MISSAKRIVKNMVSPQCETMFFYDLKNKIFGCIFGDKRCRIGEENGADSVKKRGTLTVQLAGQTAP